MASFKYKALNTLGEQTEGVVEAEDLPSAITKLQDDSLSILSIKEKKKSFGIIDFFKELSKQRSPKDIDKVNFLRQLSMMLNGGHTLSEGLALCAEMSGKKPLQDAIVDMIVRLQQGGATFSTALEAQGKIFPPFLSKMIAVGERTGNLNVALERAADHMEQNSILKNQFINSLIYPAIVLLVALAVFTGLSFFVIPRFVDLFQGATPDNLPYVSRFMLGFSQWINIYGVPILIFLAAVILAVTIAYKLGFAKRTFDNIFIRLPFIGTNLIHTNMAQMGWSMSALLKNEQSLIESLQFVADNATNYNIAASLSNAREAVIEGRTLGYGLRQPHIPAIVQQMCAVGERSGELPNATQSLGEYFQREAENRMIKLKAVMEPVTILFVAGIVGFVYLSFFNAVISIGSGFGMY